jgi:nitrate reductase gamma subunit
MDAGTSGTHTNMNGVLKVAYKPLGMVVGVLGGVAANLVFGQIWKRLSNEPTAPNATDEDYSTREVLIAAVLQGAIFGLVKTAIDRAGMRGYQRLIGDRPAR